MIIPDNNSFINSLTEVNARGLYKIKDSNKKEINKTLWRKWEMD